MGRSLLVGLAAALMSITVVPAQPTPDQAPPARRARTLRLLELMHFRDQALRGLEIAAANMRQTNPGGATLFSAEVRESMVKTLLTMRAQLEEKYLTEKEVEDLIAFYETPLGQKLAETELAIALDLAKLVPRGPGAAVGGPGPAGTASAPVRVGGDIKEPKKLKNVNPVYPEEAKQARVQGVVILECTIRSDGTVGEVKVLRGVPMLDTAAVAAVRQWVYEPTSVNGVAVPVIMTVTVTFKLS